MLASTKVIANYTIGEVSGDMIRYRVDALGGAERLRRALRFSGLIEQDGIDDLQYPVGTLQFYYSPNP